MLQGHLVHLLVITNAKVEGSIVDKQGVGQRDHHHTPQIHSRRFISTSKSSNILSCTWWSVCWNMRSQCRVGPLANYDDLGNNTETTLSKEQRMLYEDLVWSLELFKYKGVMLFSPIIECPWKFWDPLILQIKHRRPTIVLWELFHLDIIVIGPGGEPGSTSQCDKDP